MITIKDVTIINLLPIPTIINLNIESIEVQFRKISDTYTFVVLLCNCIDKNKFMIQINHKSFWIFKKLISKNLLYKYLDGKTKQELKDLISTAIILYNNNDTSLTISKVIKFQYIKL